MYLCGRAGSAGHCGHTGIASIFLTKDYTPDYNSGLAHAIFYALTAYPVIEERHLHGEVVAFGILIALLVDGQKEEFEKIYELNKSIGLPTRLSDIEITPPSGRNVWTDSHYVRCGPLSLHGHPAHAGGCMKTLEERAVSHR